MTQQQINDSTLRGSERTNHGYTAHSSGRGFLHNSNNHFLPLQPTVPAEHQQGLQLWSERFPCSCQVLFVRFSASLLTEGRQIYSSAFSGNTKATRHAPSVPMLFCLIKQHNTRGVHFHHTDLLRELQGMNYKTSWAPTKPYQLQAFFNIATSCCWAISDCLDKDITLSGNKFCMLLPTKHSHYVGTYLCKDRIMTKVKSQRPLSTSPLPRSVLRETYTGHVGMTTYPSPSFSSTSNTSSGCLVKLSSSNFFSCLCM